MNLQIASDIALTAEMIDAATGLVALSANDLLASDIIDADYTVIDAGVAPLMLTAPAIEAQPAKKVYSTPYLPRALFLKKLREEGKLAPRASSKPKAAPQQVEVKAESKPARERSPKELAAIRRSYAFARKAA